MNKKKKLGSGETLQTIDGYEKTIDDPLTSSDLLTMQKVIIQFNDEIDDTDNLSMIFHVSIIWPLDISNPEIKVSIRIKDRDQKDDFASWEKIMHRTNTEGWELKLAEILKSANEMKIDFFIVENKQRHNPITGWIQ